MSEHAIELVCAAVLSIINSINLWVSARNRKHLGEIQHHLNGKTAPPKFRG